MERDPSDDKATFIPIHFSPEPPMNNEADVRQFFKWMVEAATAASNDVGFVLYPLYRFDNGKS